MELTKLKLTSKKTGKDFTAWCVQIGEYRTPIFFPSPIELSYLKNYCESEGIKVNE